MHQKQINPGNDCSQRPDMLKHLKELQTLV